MRKTPKQKGAPPRRGSGGCSAAAAAAGEQQDDQDDPDPVVVVEDVAQTVVHSVPPENKVVERGDPVSTIIVCRQWENVRETCRMETEKTFSFSKIPLDKKLEMVYNICVRGYSLMVKLQLPKLATRVRFPSRAPYNKNRFDTVVSDLFSLAERGIIPLCQFL